MGLKVILTGATGMVGEGVLYQCLQHNDVEAVLVVGRKPCGYTHPKLKEIIHNDFFDLTPIQKQLAGYNACFFCLGVSSVGMKEPQFYQLTYTLTLHFATIVAAQNKDLTFCYISGAGTDSTEQGKSMWARVKGKTENDLMKLHFKSVYAFRPGGLKTTKGLKNTLPYYKYFAWLFPIMQVILPQFVSTLAELGDAMIHATLNGYSKPQVEVRDIHILAKKV